MNAVLCPEGVNEAEVRKHAAERVRHRDRRRPRAARRQDLALRPDGLQLPPGQRHALPLGARLGALRHGPRRCTSATPRRPRTAPTRRCTSRTRSARSAQPSSSLDTLTHALSGALLARAMPAPARCGGAAVAAGFFACAAPDLDFVVGFAGPVEYLLNHRGVTHSLLLLPLWALGVAWVLAKMLREPRGWRALYGVCAAGASACISPAT